MNNKKFSNAQEKRVAKAVGGKKQCNSGATPFAKGDVKNDLFCIECKTMTTEKDSISIKRDWIDKLKNESFAIGKRFWALVFNFGGLGNNENLYIINEKLFQQLQRYLQEDQL
jgi:hypothetical protein